MNQPQLASLATRILTGIEPCLADDLRKARLAAASISAADGWPMDEAYLSGDNDRDADVRAALAAIQLVRAERRQ